jgi:hypothetical protein
MDRIRAWFGGGSTASDDQTASAPEPATMPDETDVAVGGTVPPPPAPPPPAEPPSMPGPGAGDDRPA